MMMPGPGAGTPPTPPMGGAVGAAAGAAPGASPQPGGPPGGVGGLLGMMGGMPSTGPKDPAETMRVAMSGIQQLDQAVKDNPQLIEVLAAVLKTHPTLRLLFLAASRRPEEKAQASLASGGGRVPPILGR